jgi:putative transcriptional regulator
MNESLTNLVKEFRTRAGLTQEDLGREMGVSRQTIISIERGHYVPSLQLALKLARFFECSTEGMFRIKHEVKK